MSVPTSPAIEVSRLVKAYGGVTAVNDISFSVGRGEIVGFNVHKLRAKSRPLAEDLRTLRLTATAVAITSVANAHRFSPTTNNSIPAPATGLTLYCSSDASNQLRVKNTSGTVLSLDSVSLRTGSFALVAGTKTVADTSVTASTVVVANCTTASNQGLLSYTFTPGVGFTVTSSNAADVSTYRYALLG